MSRGVATQFVQLRFNAAVPLGLWPSNPTNTVVEMRRLIAQRSLDRQSIETTAEQRFPEIALKTVIEQVGGAISPRGARLLAKNDGDKFAAIAGGAHHDIVAGVADEASFHTIRARKADQHPVMSAYDFVANLNLNDAEEVGVLRKLDDDGSGKLSEIARSCNLA